MKPEDCYYKVRGVVKHYSELKASEKRMVAERRLAPLKKTKDNPPTFKSAGLW
ncbi:hypothetical protein KKC44_02980 [Patescibacteria group bacterium]|nr:hypothetical protein [Patescibacteria group bacterium]MBU2259549.1 hypothetical protein [Patescibacteria group bacterium]